VLSRWMTGCKSSRTGIWQHNRHLSLMPISASIVDWAKPAIQTRCGVALRLAYPLHRNHSAGRRILVVNLLRRALLRTKVGVSPLIDG